MLFRSVDIVEELGSDSYLHCTADDVAHDRVVVRAQGLSRTGEGAQVRLGVRPGAVHLFDDATGVRLAD